MPSNLQLLPGTQEDLGYKDNGNKGILDTIYQQISYCYVRFNKYLKHCSKHWEEDSQIHWSQWRKDLSLVDMADGVLFQSINMLLSLLRKKQ